MLTRILAVALLAGGLAGLAVTALQTLTVEPLILAAESYEQAPVHHHGKAMPQAATDARTADQPSHDVATPGLTRVAITTVATVGAAVGFALMLLAVMLASQARIDWRCGLVWGACGFAACGLAPAMGLAPQLPGAAEADLTLRQVWWVATAVTAAGGLWLLLCSAERWAMALGAALLLVPHVVGAPHPVSLTSTVPAEIAAAFTARSLAMQAVMWLLLAALSGLFWSRGETREVVSP